jgi:hypothetical protein
MIRCESGPPQPQGKNELMDLRPYQQECVDIIEARGAGRWLIQMATGTGKTVVFASLPRRGRTLILSHREELIHQPLKYFDCLCGIEQAGQSAGYEDVVSASVQSMVRRLDRFRPDEFDTIIVDEAHHSSSPTYRKILEHFKPRRVLGFTATPNRGDGVRLDDVFDEIIFERDLRWGIENGWLSPIYAKRCNINYDLSAVRTKMGDFAANDLEKAVNIEAANRAVASALEEHGHAPGLIFAVSVDHAHALAECIEGAMALDGTSKDRDEVLTAFKAGEIPWLINCALFTEGTDLPNVQTVGIARPTLSAALYTQMVGRSTRLFPGKERAYLIDFVGVTSKPICTAPTLIGIDMSPVPAKYHNDIEGDLLKDLPPLIQAKSDTPEAWIRNVQVVDLWAKRMEYSMHDVRWYRHPDGRMRVELPGPALGEIPGAPPAAPREEEPSWRGPNAAPRPKVARGPKRWLEITPPNLVGLATLKTQKMVVLEDAPYQRCLDAAYQILDKCAKDEATLWKRSSFARWGATPASDKQKDMIRRRRIDLDYESLTKGEATMVLQRLFN